MYLSALRSIGFLIPFLVSTVAEINQQQNDAEIPFPARVARSFIIEYAPGSRERQSLASQDGISVLKVFDSSVFQGALIETDILTQDDLSSAPDVLDVWPNELIELLPTFEQQAPVTDDAPIHHDNHNATGVNKLHAQGIFGKGVKIGIVDTGVWYDHPALGGGYGAGFKVSGGHDFVGDGRWPQTGAKVPDDDPKDQQGHGTHVAGIIAGRNDYWVGVAPEASLYAYKVFTSLGSTDTATLVEAFLAAFEDGMDIITASIGGANGYSDNIWAKVASRLVDEGVVVTISAGNSGEYGPFYGSSGSSGNNVLAVASAETERYPASPFRITINGNAETLGYIPALNYFPPEIVDWPVVSLSLDPEAEAEACQPYPEGTQTLTGVIPLIRKGGCYHYVKQNNLSALGAKYILMLNNDDALEPPLASSIGAITAGDGKKIIESLKAVNNVTADFSLDPELPFGIEDPTGNRANPFTSWAALYNLELKPDIAAPGGNIFSTWFDGGYKILSGTSMSCPYVAGVAALYISAHGGRSVQGKEFAYRLSRRIISSGRAIPWSNGTAATFPFSASTSQVGNGMIDAYKILSYDTQLDFRNIALNDTRYFNRYHDLRVTNNGSEAVTYRFSQHPAGGVDALIWDPSDQTKRVSPFAQLSPKEYTPVVSLPQDILLQPGESRKVSINFDNPDNLGWNASALPLYSGKVTISGSNGEFLSVPYLGLGGDLKNQLTTLNENGFPYLVSTLNQTHFIDKPTFSFNLSNRIMDYPKIYTKFIWGTTEIRWDIYEEGFSERSWKYPPVVGEDSFIGSVASWVGSNNGWPFRLGTDDPDETYTYPETNIIRATSLSWGRQHWWFGKLGNGSQIAPGNYTMRFAALKPFGNPFNADNWDVYRPTGGLPKIEVTGQY
ncbi:unnamed protein product [Clonostachys chloroleuca]|uniref:Minor extracellular protease vpr n=1 Tax=Clonostachys chloroleuca TaxID=1926264 RepID=A0AA35M0D4_9HYPO|nr:unnamed protein product [Clonostachys chloroleuca]